MKKRYLIIIVLLAGLVSSCEKSEDIPTPSGIEEGYHMPQGNNPFDATIMGYYEKYGSCFLYKFTDKDTYWTPSGWKNGVTSPTMTGGLAGYIVAPSQEEIYSSTVSSSGEMLVESILRCFSEKIPSSKNYVVFESIYSFFIIFSLITLWRDSD